jgi:hypothetical protein
MADQSDPVTPQPVPAVPARKVWTPPRIQDASIAATTFIKSAANNEATFSKRGS